MSSSYRTVFVWVCLLVAAVCAAWLLQEEGVRAGSAAEFQSDVAGEAVARVTFDGDHYVVTTDRGDIYTLDLSDVSESAYAELHGQGITLEYAVPEGSLLDLGGPVSVGLAVVVGGIVLLGLLAYAVRRMQPGNHRLLDLSKSRARLLEEPPATRFSDVGGCHEAKERLTDLVDFLREPAAWEAAGARVPRGVLLEGAPGIGKTHLARAVAGEARVKFFVTSGSEFVEMLIGVGASRVRELFEAAAKVAPAVIFIDELDAIGRRRGSGAANWNEERELTLNQLLACMDGFKPTDRVVVIGATNRADILDPALVRAGRFDVVLSLPPLDEPSRLEVLKIHSRGKPLAPEVDLAAWAQRTRGATGATLEQLVNEAALRAVRLRKARGAVSVCEDDLVAAWTSVSHSPGGLDELDRALVGSAWQLVRPEGARQLRVRLSSGEVAEGELLWADGVYLKLRGAGGDVAIAKAQIVSVEPVAAA